jgi:hypothetical protein
MDPGHRGWGGAIGVSGAPRSNLLRELRILGSCDVTREQEQVPVFKAFNASVTPTGGTLFAASRRLRVPRHPGAPRLEACFAASK